MRIGIFDIARRLNLSTTTLLRALNSHGGCARLKMRYNRMNYCCQPLTASGFPFRQELAVERDLTRPGGYQLTKRLISIPDPPNILFLINKKGVRGANVARHEEAVNRVRTGSGRV